MTGQICSASLLNLLQGSQTANQQGPSLARSGRSQFRQSSKILSHLRNPSSPFRPSMKTEIPRGSSRSPFSRCNPCSLLSSITRKCSKLMMALHSRTNGHCHLIRHKNVPRAMVSNILVHSMAGQTVDSQKRRERRQPQKTIF